MTLLQIAYAPMRLSLYRQGALLTEQALGSLPDAPDKAKDWLEHRQALRIALQQDATNLFGLGGIVTSFAPIVVAAAPKLLE